MAKKGKAKNGPATGEGEQVSAPAAATTNIPAADPVRPATAPVKEVKLDVKPAPEKKANPPKQANGAAENGSEGETGEMRRKRSRRGRKKKSDETSDEQSKDKAPSTVTARKNLRKKRSKLMRTLEQLESNPAQASPEGKPTQTAEDIRKKVQIIENLLQHLQAQTQEEKKKMETLKSGKADVQEPPKSQQPAAKVSETAPKNLTSEKARKEGEVKKLANEKAEIQNEAKRLAQEKARKEQEMRKLIEEKAKKDAEAKQLLEEKAAREAELAKLNQAKARVETVEQKINELDQKVQQRKEADEVKVAPGSPKQKKEQARTRKDSESSKKKEVEEKAKKEAEEKTKKEAAEKVKKEAEEKAKKEAAEKVKKEAEEKAKKEAAEKAKKEAEEKAKKEAAEKAKKEAEEKAKKEAAEKAKKEAAEKAKKETEEKAKKEAAEKAKKEAEEKAKKEAAEKAKKEAEEKAKKEAAEKAKKEAEEKAKKEAAEKAKKEAEEKAKKEAAEKAKKEAEEKAKKEAAEKAKKEAEEKAKKEAAEKAKKEAEEKAKKEAAEKAKKEAEEKAKKEAAEKAKKEAEEKAKKEAEEKAKKEAAEKAKQEAAEKAKQEAAEKAKKLAEEEAKRKTNGEAAKHANGSAPTTPTQEKPATSKQDAKNSKKNNKRTPKNSVSEDEKSTVKVTGSKNGQSGDFASSAEPVTVAKSQESQSAPVPIPKTPEAAPASPKSSPKPANAKPAVPANGKQQTPPAKTPEKSPPQPKTAARSSPPKTTAKAPSPPKTTPAAAKAPPKPSTPPASKKPEPPPKPEFLKKKSPSVEKEKIVPAKVAPTATAPQQVPQQAPAAAPSPSSVPAPSTPAPVPAPATVPTPAPAELTLPAEGAARLTEEALNGAKKPASAGSGAASKSKPVQKKPEVPPKPDVHSKSAAKMKTPIKQPGGKTSTVTMTSEPVQNKHLTTIQSDSRSPAAELSRTEAFKKNMDIISTIADVLLSHSRSKKICGTGSSANDNSKPTANSSPNSPSSSTSTSLEPSSPSSASFLSSLFPSLSQSSGPAASTSHQASSPPADTPKQKSKLDLERILRILQASQPPSRSGGTDPGQAASASSSSLPSGSDPSASSSIPLSEMLAGTDGDEHPLGSFLTKDAIRMLMPTLQEVNVKFNVEKQLNALNATAAMAKILPKTLPPGTDTTEEDEEEEDLLDEEAEDTIEYKFTPRPVFIATICQVCKNPLKSFFHCERCLMVSYCGDEHRRMDQPSHRDLCTVLCEIASNRGGHIYQLAKKLNVQEYRNLRVHTLNQIELSLKRAMQAFEREIVLFPRICLAPDCREWRQELLTECIDCRQVSYCTANPTHLQASHRRWCKAYLLFQKLILRQRILGRIEPVLPTRILTKSTPLPANIDEAFKQLYKNSTVPRDECVYAVLSQIATAPLSALYAFQQTGLSFGNTFTIHLVGAELQFEGDTLDKWEAFFLHLVPEVAVLRVVFVGPELNVENLPIDVISRFRMCRTCRLKCRVVAFDFQCRTMYHDYRHSSRYQRPNLICFFNPGLHRTTGFAGLDSWPATIHAATEAGCPMLVTAYTELESPLDLDRLQRESTRTLQIVQSPAVNPFASKRPDRNFISDDTAPMIFKNYYYFVVK